MRESRIGICHLCGSCAKLSFEHLPPEAAFNDRRILKMAFDEVLRSKNLDKVRGKLEQRGAGAYTLCERCNNDTGSWYGSAYVGWAQQAMLLLLRTGGKPSLHYPFNIFPLRVLKQVVCMFFSVNGARFQEKHPDLVRFILNKESRHFPDNVRVYAFYTFSNRSRMAGITGVIRGLGSGSAVTCTFSEITFPPFGFIMTYNDMPAPDESLYDISFFSRFSYRDWRVGMSMCLPWMPVYTPFPGDYRTRERTLADQQTNMCAEEQLAALESAR